MLSPNTEKAMMRSGQVSSGSSKRFAIGPAAANSFAVWNFRRLEFHVHVIAPSQAAYHNLQMLLTVSGEQKFLGLSIAVET